MAGLVRQRPQQADPVVAPTGSERRTYDEENGRREREGRPTATDGRRRRHEREGEWNEEGRDGRKEGSDEAGWKKQEDCSLMEGEGESDECSLG